MKPYNLKIAAGVEEPYTFSRDSNFILLDESATVTVTVKSPDSNEQTVLSAGDWAKLTPFTDLRLSHDGTADTVFTIYVGRNTMKGSQRIGGSVEVTGGSKNTASPPLSVVYRPVRLGRSYVAMYSTGTIPVSFSDVFQLYNPLGSGVKLLVNHSEIGVTSPGSYVFNTGAGAIGAVVIASRSASLYAGSTPHKAELRWMDGGINGMIFGNFSGDYKYTQRGYAGALSPAGGILIPEGYGLAISPMATYMSDGAFEWEEIL